MKRFVFRLLSIAAVFFMFLPVSSLAAAQGPDRPESGDANGYSS